MDGQFVVLLRLIFKKFFLVFSLAATSFCWSQKFPCSPLSTADCCYRLKLKTSKIVMDEEAERKISRKKFFFFSTVSQSKIDWRRNEVNKGASKAFYVKRKEKIERKREERIKPRQEIFIWRILCIYIYFFFIIRFQTFQKITICFFFTSSNGI